MKGGVATSKFLHAALGSPGNLKGGFSAMWRFMRT